MHIKKLSKSLDRSNVGMKRKRFNLNELFSSRSVIKSILLTSTLLVSACLTGEEVIEPEVGTVGAISGFYGAVVSEEPASAIIARDILTSGGTAADAAVAMSFAMAVTYPTRAGLGGGGVCLVHDSSIGLTETLDFTTKPGSLKQGDRPAAIPGFVRGMAMLNARYGTMQWRELLLDAEELARNGFRMSRAMHQDLEPYADLIMKDSGIRSLYGTATGQILPEGYLIKNIELAALISQIRAKGAGVFYQGNLSKRIAASIQNAGGNVSPEDLSRYLPEWRGVLSVGHGDKVAYFPEPPAGGGSVMAQMLAMGFDDDRYETADEQEKTHMLLEFAKKAYADQQSYLQTDWTIKGDVSELLSPEVIERLLSDYSAEKASAPYEANVKFFDSPFNTGFVISDRNGNAAACEFSLNNYLGNGRIANSFGFVVSAAPISLRRNPTNLSPAILAGSVSGRFFAGLAGSGGSLKKIGTVRTLLELMNETSDIASQIDQSNIGLSWDLKSIVAEDSITDEMAVNLKNKGHKIAKTTTKASINGLYCAKGLPTVAKDLYCDVKHEPDGHGLSLMTAPRQN